MSEKYGEIVKKIKFLTDEAYYNMPDNIVEKIENILSELSFTDKNGIYWEFSISEDNYPLCAIKNYKIK